MRNTPLKAFIRNSSHSPIKQKISFGSKTYDDLNPEMRRAVEGQPGMPTQEQLEAEKKEKDDPGVQNISF